MTERLASFARGGGAVDYEQRLDMAALREQRLAAARRALAESDLDALLLWKDENVRYVSGLRAQLIQGKTALLNGCLLTPDDLVLFVSGGEVDRVRAVMPWVEEVHAVPIMEARGLIAGAVESVVAPALDRRGLGRARLGLDELAYAQVLELGRALPGLTLEDGDAVMQSARRVKSELELAVMQEASAIAEATTEAAIAAVAPGVRENDVVAAAMSALYRLGGEMAHLATPFVASGEHMAPPNRFASDKIIREGDLVFIDIGAMWNGYFADMGRTVICGEPNDDQRRVFGAVHAALMAATAAMRPGNTNDDVAAAVRAAGAEHGLDDSFLSLFIGHGVGIGANEPPYVGEVLPGAETVPLEEGMTMAIEPLIWIPGVRGGAGVRLEDTIVVAPQGGVALTRTSFDRRLSGSSASTAAAS
ncbi:MAG TPA: Xaa-Pro peptidase family protein [Solirubrobacterales bacterium]|nr:Xaa-Pro peptidase family protein [Solirubrobacterales bacterium]